MASMLLRVLVPLRSKSQAVQIVAGVAFIWLFVVFALRYTHLTIPTPTSPFRSATSSKDRLDLDRLESINLAGRYMLDYPLVPPYKNIFGQLGERAELLRSWLEELEASGGTPQDDDDRASRKQTANLIEQVAVSLFPYLKPKSKDIPKLSPLTTLRRRLGDANDQEGDASPHIPNAGIVIPTGQGTLRFACHLVASLTRVHGTQLPIEIVYAGDEDLSLEGREALKHAAHGGATIDFIDILTVFDDDTLQLVKGGWAIKPFAALASRFDQVVLLDADTVFLQDPAQLLKQERYEDTGVLLFHDRLLWKGGFADRQDWWHNELKHPSPETNKSLVWTERYSEEGDSGVVVVDKTRLDVLIGLLHIGWQNSHDVREEVTYKITYGDKETWWIGFEATGSRYAFSHHYGGMVGWIEEPHETRDTQESQTPALNPLPKETRDGDKEPKPVRVCSFVIAHVDEGDHLLWYNGGLLKNKLANQTEFEVPTHWMMDQEWHKGSKKEMSCMVGTEVDELTEHERDILRRSIDIARDVDERLHLVPTESQE
ncbi:hypothetical protein G7046_g5142 [Stylonectria norvegica]|nr:hypothetical protein G7046_g5142 [Stylonectria norvegica]